MEENFTAVIVDDENLAREVIKKYLKEFPQIKILSESSNGFEGAKAINELNPDILFLDIQMPKLTGFEMLELLDQIPVTIFTTAYDQYAIKAFEVNAIDYLLKPFSQDRFNEAVKKAVASVKNKTIRGEEVKELVNAGNFSNEIIDRVVIKNGQKISIVPVDNILLLEAQDDYVLIYSTEGKFLKQKTMKYFEEHLNPRFFIRIHRSFIVRLDFIEQLEIYEKDSYRVHLKDQKILPVSKTGYSRLKEILNY
jgi:two-component system LytT family response regulator